MQGPHWPSYTRVRGIPLCLLRAFDHTFLAECYAYFLLRLCASACAIRAVPSLHKILFFFLAIVQISSRARFRVTMLRIVFGFSPKIHDEYSGKGPPFVYVKNGKL